MKGGDPAAGPLITFAAACVGHCVIEGERSRRVMELALRGWASVHAFACAHG